MDWFSKIFQRISNLDPSLLSSIFPITLVIYFSYKPLLRMLNFLIAERYRSDKSIEKFSISDKGAISFERFPKVELNELDLSKSKKKELNPN